MTFLAGIASVVLVAISALLSVQVSSTATEHARAQLAADAAALAAAAESGPYGAGQPGTVAARFARANGAVVTSCLCEPGATAMQVEVDLDGTTAVARAVMDPELLRPISGEVDMEGLNPLFRNAVGKLIEESRGAVYVVSAYRSIQEQRILWAEALRRYGSAEAADDWVAPPGRSMHERGLAVDLGGEVEAAAALGRRLGLPVTRPLANEPWHFEPPGARS